MTLRSSEYSMLRFAWMVTGGPCELGGVLAGGRGQSLRETRDAGSHARDHVRDRGDFSEPSRMASPSMEMMSGPAAKTRTWTRAASRPAAAHDFAAGRSRLFKGTASSTVRMSIIEIRLTLVLAL
jgi:hypothetical protein